MWEGKRCYGCYVQGFVYDILFGCVVAFSRFWYVLCIYLYFVGNWYLCIVKMRVICEQFVLLKVYGWCFSLYFNFFVGVVLSKVGFFWGSYVDVDFYEFFVSGFY